MKVAFSTETLFKRWEMEILSLEAFPKKFYKRRVRKKYPYSSRGMDFWLVK